MAKGKGKELNAQLFIEGRHVPFNSATCTYQVGQPGTAAITMVPLRELNDILPRTMVHLFVKDQSAPGVAKPWVLLFEGEVYGFGGSKTANNRNLVLYCMGLSNYWDNAKQYYLNLKTSYGNGLQTLASQKAAQDARRDQAQVITTESGIEAYLTRIVTNALNANKDFLTAVTEIMQNVKNINSFFRYSDARYRISERITFASSGNIKELFNFQNANNLMDSLAGRGNGGLVTVRQVVESLMALIFHDFASIPAPSKVTSEALKKTKKGIGKNGEKSIGSFVFKPNTFLLPPPRCNVLFPDMYDSFSFNRNFFHEVTRFKLQPSPPGIQTDAIQGAQVFQQTVYAPTGFTKFSTGADSEKSDEENEMFKGPNQGKVGDKSEGITKTSNTLQDFNYLSHEEILKGIFPELGNSIPAAQVFAKTGKFSSNSKYYQRAADFLFHKKRLAARSISSSGPLNIAAVPGFPMLVLDDSAAEQHVTGVLTQISHTINASQGGYTQYQIEFARPVEEKDMWTGEMYEPPVPPFYDAKIFGSRRGVKPSDYSSLPKEQQSRVKGLKTVNDFGNTTLDTYYAKLLGDSLPNSHQGAQPITSKTYPTLVGATLHLMNQYRTAKASDTVERFIESQTRRDYVTIEENFKFLGADTSIFKKKGNYSPDVYRDLSNVVFKGGTFDGGFVDAVTDKNKRDDSLKELFRQSISKRRKIVNSYRERLMKERGFRG